MNRAVCCLSPALNSLCEMGCIYREKALKHLACPIAQKYKETCVAPCLNSAPCVCKTKVVLLTKKERNEVLLL